MKRSTATDAQIRLYNNATGSSNDTIIRLHIAGTSAKNIFYFGDGDDSNVGMMRYLHSNDSIDFTTGAAERLLINSAGITVTGEVAASQDYPNFRPTLDLNFAAEKKLDPRITYRRTGPASFTNEFGKVVLVGDNVPRFDHDPVTRESKGLLIEESRTNLVDDNTNYTGWTDYSSTHAKTTDVKAPDGSFNAWKVTSTGAQSQFGLYDAISYTANTKYTHSMWLKAGNVTRVGLTVSSGSRWSVMPYLVVDLDTGTVNATGSSLSTKLTAYPNGWYLLEATGTFGSTTQADGIWSYTAQSGGFSGNTTAYFYQWGGQAEAGEFATSFIPTDGSHGSQTIRGRDIVDIDEEDFTDFYNQTESTIISSHTLLPNIPNAENVYVYQIQDASTNNAIRVIDKNSSYSNFATGLVISSGSSVFHFNNTTDSYTKDKVLVALSVKNNDFAGCHNGGTVETDTSGTLPTNFNSLGIGRYPPAGGYELNGHIQRFIYYPKQLSDSQLKTLTS